MASRRNRRECQLQASFLNFANEVDGLSSSDMDDNESIVTTSPVENFSIQEESDCCSVGPRPSTPLESDVNRFFIKCISSFIIDTLLLFRHILQCHHSSLKVKSPKMLH